MQVDRRQGHNLYQPRSPWAPQYFPNWLHRRSLMHDSSFPLPLARSTRNSEQAARRPGWESESLDAQLPGQTHGALSVMSALTPKGQQSLRVPKTRSRSSETSHTVLAILRSTTALNETLLDKFCIPRMTSVQTALVPSNTAAKHLVLFQYDRALS